MGEIYDKTKGRYVTEAVVEVKGSKLDLRGIAANKPAASEVDAGTTYWSVDTDPSADAIEVSDGSTWTVME